MISTIGLSTDSIAILVSVFIMFYFFRQIMYYVIDKHENTVNKLSDDHKENLTAIREDFSTALDRIERRGRRENKS